jgi:hypothetical protein
MAVLPRPFLPLDRQTVSRVSQCRIYYSIYYLKQTPSGFPRMGHCSTGMRATSRTSAGTVWSRVKPRMPFSIRGASALPRRTSPRSSVGHCSAGRRGARSSSSSTRVGQVSSASSPREAQRTRRSAATGREESSDGNETRPTHDGHP